MTAAFEMTLETLSLNRPYYLSEVWSQRHLSLFNSKGCEHQAKRATMSSNEDKRRSGGFLFVAVGLVLVDALVVSGIDRAGFFWIESEVGETLTGAHLSGARDQVVWVDLADRGLRRRSWRQKTGRQTETLPPWKGRYSSNCQRPI